MVPVMNLGAFTPRPIYRAKGFFIGQDWTDVNPDAGISTDVAPPDLTVPTDVTPSTPDWGSPIDTGAPVTESGAATDVGGIDTSGTQTLPSVTSEATPSQLSVPSGASGAAAAPSSGGAASSSPDVLSSIGKFFTGLFTPGNIAAAAKAAAAASAPKPKPAPVLTLPIGSQGIPIDSGTLIIAGGVTVGVIALIAILK